MSAATAATSTKSGIEFSASVSGKIDSIESMRNFIDAFDDMINRNDNLSGVAFESMGSDEYIVSVSGSG